MNCLTQRSTHALRRQIESTIASTVHRRQQDRGLGKALLFDALKRIEEAAVIVAVRAVMVHAIDEAARRFYAHFEFEPSRIDPFQLLQLLNLRKALK